MVLFFSGCQTQRHIEMALQQENQALERQIQENYAFMQHQQRRISDLEKNAARSDDAAVQPASNRPISTRSATGVNGSSPRRSWLNPETGSPTPSSQPTPREYESPLDRINADPEALPNVTVPNTPSQNVPRNLFRNNSNNPQTSLEPAMPDISYLPKVNVSELTEISIDPQQIGPLDINYQNKEEGLRLVLNCQTAQGGTAVAAGKVTIVALNPSLSGDDARIARWDVTPEQVERQIQEAPQPDGILFELGWPEDKPAGDIIDVFVRMEDESGHRLQTRQQVQMNAPRYALWSPPTGVALPEDAEGSELAENESQNGSEGNTSEADPKTYADSDLQQGEVYKSEIVVAAPKIESLRNRTRTEIAPVDQVTPPLVYAAADPFNPAAQPATAAPAVGANAAAENTATAGRPAWSPYR